MDDKLLENGTLRILHPDGSTAGTGFLVTWNLAVTCAHLINDPSVPVAMKFSGQDETFSAWVALEYDSEARKNDVAFLRVEKLPESSEPLRFDPNKGNPSGRSFVAFGYPLHQEDEPGSYVEGRIASVTNIDGQYMLSLKPNSKMAGPGWSGAPVLDEERGRVAGMIVHAPTSPTENALAIPAHRLWQLCDEIPSPGGHKSAKPPLEEMPPEESPPPTAKEEKGQRDKSVDEGSIKLPDYQVNAHPVLRPTISHAQRVLNLNFAAADGSMLGLFDPLQPGQLYDLMVNVGPYWGVLRSLLPGDAIFPEDSKVPYLRTADRQKGWFDVEVVFVSQEFEPNLVSGRMRLTVGSLEGSTPYIDGNLSEKSGPLRLRLSPKQGISPRARGRVCLYYGAQVLQSAIIDVGVGAQQPGALNMALVDYILTPGFEKVSQDLARRRRSTGDGKTTETTVKVGLMLNDDLSGTHRLLLKVNDEGDETLRLPPAWKAYDSTAIGETLEEARRILVNPSAKPHNYESDTFLFDKFKDDLLALAKLGAGLYNMLLQGLTPAEGISPLVWRKKFRSALEPGDVIQLARAGSVPSTHVIPWALVYDHLLEPERSDRPLRLCRIVDEQWDARSAKRKRPFSAQSARSAQDRFTCPYEHEHDDNVVCPFGFWGYKYTLEQPISALLGKSWDVEPARLILAEPTVKVALAATHDVPRESRRQEHFRAIRGALNAEYIPLDPASERDQVRDSLRAPQIVYILCHGGKDGKTTYLSIGPRSTDARYTITPELPGSWGERDFIDVEKWAETRPLVFINGCYTTDLLPELTLNFVSAFRDLLAGGVIGTEIPVTVEDGYLAAEKFFERLGRGADVGQAILGMRWDLLNQGSLLGLAYTPYAMADLQLKR